jgi:hypothetical protein
MQKRITVRTHLVPAYSNRGKRMSQYPCTAIFNISAAAALLELQSSAMPHGAAITVQWWLRKQCHAASGTAVVAQNEISV